MEIGKARKQMAFIWSGFSILIIIILLAQTILGDKHGKDSQEIWNNIIQSIWPILALFLGLIFDIKIFSDKKQINKLTFNVIWIVSALYLLTLLSTILYQPYSGKPLIEMMKKWLIIKGVISGLLFGAIGKLFVAPGTEGE